MGLFEVDENKCARDGLCTAVCPVAIITRKDADAVPVPADRAEELCIRCGHCVAVCPHGALAHREMVPEDCPEVRPDELPGPEAAERFLRSRRSVRNYRKDPVARETLERLIRVARYAPSGHNSQPVQWLVVQDPQEVQRLAGQVVDWMRHMLRQEPAFAREMNMDRIVAARTLGYDAVCRHAPHLIVAHAPEDLRPAQSACTIALAYLELAAPSLGLGTCWAGFFTAAAVFWPPLRQDLDLPRGHLTFGAVMVGRPRFPYRRLPLRDAPRILWR